MGSNAVLDVLSARRWIIIGVIAVALLALPLFSHVLRPTYTATAEVALVGSPLNSNVVLPATDVPDLALSEPVVQAIKEKLHLSLTLDQIQSRLSAKMSAKSDVMPISFRDKNKELAAIVPNAAADATVAAYRDLATRQFDSEIADLRRQLQEQQDRVAAIDSRLGNAVQKDVYAGSPGSLDRLSSHLDDLTVARAQANASLVADQAAASSSADRGKLASVIREQAQASDPYYTTLRTGAAKDFSDLKSAQAGYTSSYPGLPGLKEKVDLETRAVDHAADAAARDHDGASATYAQLLLTQRSAIALVAGDKARVDALDRQIDATRRHIDNLATFGVPANTLRLQRDGSAAAYQQVALRLEQALSDKAQAAALGSLVVIDYAHGASPRLPAFALAILLAFLICAVAIGAAYAAEFIDPRVRSRNDVEDLYGAPLFGSISR